MPEKWGCCRWDFKSWSNSNLWSSWGDLESKENQMKDVQWDWRTFDHQKDQIIDIPTATVCSYFSFYNTCAKLIFSSRIELKYYDEFDKHWILKEQNWFEKI